jgi:CubicO group peptidase (beta-lactamase class C family)
MTRYESYGFAGTVLVAKNGGIVLLKGYGLADRTRKIPNGPATRFEVASLTKTFTAAAVLQLESRGLLRTDDPLGKYLGRFPSPKDRATIHHLATHTGGLVREGTDLGEVLTRQAFVDAMKRTPAESQPGERYRYSNAGYSMLAAVIEVVSGTSYETYIRRHLFIPAGISGAGFRGDFTGPDGTLAKGYLGPPHAARESVEVAYPWGTRGAGGMIATVPEMYQWVIALEDTAVLPSAARAKMFQARPEEGYGWHVETDRRRGIPVIHKGGGMPQYASQILRYPSVGLLIIWASNNLQQRWRQALNHGLTASALGEPVELPPAVARVSPERLRHYESRCFIQAGASLSVQAGNGFLQIHGSDSLLPGPFYPVGQDTFAAFNPRLGTVTRLTFDSSSHHLAIESTENGQASRFSARCRKNRNG